MRVHSAAVLLAALCLACDHDGGPGLETFTANLTGAAERPNPVTTTATGSATLTLSANGDTLTYSVSATGLSGTGATATHIHGPADTGTATGIAHGLNLVAATGVIATGTVTTPSNGTISFDSLLVLMRTGLAYVNVHTTANASGEIRGQIRRQ